MLARNTLWNLLGQAAPALVALPAIPVLVSGLGTDRFGVLTLAWTGIGYFSLFDLGLGRSLTQLVSEKLGARAEQEVPALVWTGLLFMMVPGAAGALAAVLLSPWLVQAVLKIPGPLQHETLQSFYLMALSIPMVISTAGLRGVLEAYGRFGVINLVRIPMGMMTFLGPLLALPFSKSLVLSTAVLAATRLVFWAVHLWLCLRLVPALRQRVMVNPAAIGPLVRFGGWMTVTNIVSPLMSYLDRFLVAAILSVASVAYYATPYEMVTKVGIIPGALVGVLFPTFAATFGRSSGETAVLFGRGVRYIMLALFPIVSVIVAFGHEGLRIWLGADFALHGTRVLQWLAVGVLINGPAQVPFALVQGAGRPDLTARLHLLELPVYLVLLWWLTQTWGIEGAAIAWVLRVAVDTVLLFGMAGRLLPDARPMVGRMAGVMAGSLLALGLLMAPAGLVTRGLFLACMLVAYTVVAWGVILEPSERGAIFGL